MDAKGRAEESTSQSRIAAAVAAEGAEAEAGGDADAVLDDGAAKADDAGGEAGGGAESADEGSGTAAVVTLGADADGAVSAAGTPLETGLSGLQAPSKTQRARACWALLLARMGHLFLTTETRCATKTGVLGRDASRGEHAPQALDQPNRARQGHGAAQNLDTLVAEPIALPQIKHQGQGQRQHA